MIDFLHPGPTEEDLADEDYERKAEHVRKAKEAAEELRLRTCHIAGLAEDTDPESIRKLCEGWGEVETLRIDKDADGLTFGLVEFKETKVAHVVKMQRSFLVDDDRVLVFTEAKSHVDNAKVEEMTVQFQAPIIDAMNMRSVLAQQVPFAEKLAKVKAAATEILTAPPDGEAKAASDEARKKDKKEKKKDKKDKKEKKDKKLKKDTDGKEELRKEKKEKKKDKDKRKDKKKEKKDKEGQLPKRPKLDADTAEAEALIEEEEEEEMVDIDEEVEVMAEGEVVGLMGSSSSSSSNSDYGADALVELPMDVSAPDEVSDGDDVVCDAPTPLRPLKGKGKGKGKLLLRGRGLGISCTPRMRGLLPPLRGLPRSPPPKGAIDLDDTAVLDLS
ncbi:unnamed protein product [Symbiodinium pilosum]|uniref:RRM domain-containing protein n=1 Tax=Symbiodinium pilosum TaxID=2952 RepID=A0A812WAX5_SYMPI|nr:unnamed protein product [Symbiodinium pilosum]